MGTAFSSSLLGLAGSLILGFLDLQAGQAQNRFFQEFENWLSTQTEVSNETSQQAAPIPHGLGELQSKLDRALASLNDNAQGQKATAAMASLAEGIQGLVHHMRNEQQLIRDWVEAQNNRHIETHKLLEAMAKDVKKDRIS